MSKRTGPWLAAAAGLLIAGSASAQQAADTFRDGGDGAKVHASGFVCPQRIGEFERDAVGEADPERQSDFCAYSALNGVYGTVVLMPVSGAYDPKASLASQFGETETTGGRKLAENTVALKGLPLSVYTRTYRTAGAEGMEYRTLFAAAAIRNWGVELTMEYASPRDAQLEEGFVDAVYSAAQREIGVASPAAAAK